MNPNSEGQKCTDLRTKCGQNDPEGGGQGIRASQRKAVCYVSNQMFLASVLEPKPSSDPTLVSVSTCCLKRNLERKGEVSIFDETRIK